MEDGFWVTKVEIKLRHKEYTYDVTCAKGEMVIKPRLSGCRTMTVALPALPQQYHKIVALAIKRIEQERTL